MMRLVTVTSFPGGSDGSKIAGCSSRIKPVLVGSVYAAEHGGGYETMLLPPAVAS